VSLHYDPELLDELRELAVSAACEAAEMVHEGQRAGVRVADTKSSGTDIVTEMDRRSEALLVDRILSARPDDGILGEEGADHVGETGIRWILDPIDGTVNYLYGIPGWAVSVAAEIDGVMVVGVVAAPSLGETYVAVAGHGAHRHDAHGIHRLRVNDPVELASARLGPGSATPRTGARRRPAWWRRCCRGCATSGVAERAASTCASSPPDGSTPTTSADRAPGTTPPAG
jgi:myo-inositol-1(or 4)-monophosphatase